MPINSLDMAPATTVEAETTVPTTQTVGGSALGVVSQAEAAYQASLQNGTNSWLMNNLTSMSQYYIHQGTVEQIFQAHASTIYPSTLSTSQLQSNVDSNTQPTMTNSSMNTKTPKAKLDAYKPVTLTLTGQLKPSTLTKVPQVKSARSTKLKTPTAMWPNTGGLNGW